ncbi:MAG TPA: sugar ABC transporter permease [Clostridiales bacterium]|nr:sugar ABC transporter permease [Clostridiales bacterium]
MIRKSSYMYWIFLLPSLIGVMLFYCIPFLYSFYYSVIDNLGSRNFVGLENYIAALKNDLFLRASWNTLRFIAMTVPLGMIIALFLAICLQRLEKGRIVATIIILLPLVVPSGTIVFFWRILFENNGLLNELLLKLGLSYQWIADHKWQMGILVVIYLWKNVSYNVVLFWSGLNWIPKSYYEVMEMEGGGGISKFFRITLVYLSPTTFVVLLMSIINSFRVFKEVYILYGGYPSTEIYMLQHYMNNQFMSLSMQKLASAAYLMFLVIGIVLLLLYQIQKKLTDSYQ